MTGRRTRTGLAAGAVVGLLAGTVAYRAHARSGAMRRKRLRALMDRLRDGSSFHAGEPVHPRHNLPASIANFATRNAGLSDPAGLRDIAVESWPRTVRLAQAGRLRSAATRSWKAFSARQTFGLRGEGFLWDAHVPGPLGTDLEIVDSFVCGDGEIELRWTGLPIARHGGPLIDVAQAQRYLAELPLAPLAILCDHAIVWDVEDETTVLAALETLTGRAEVTFALHDGDVAFVKALRPRMPSGHAQPWWGRFEDYERIATMRVPIRAEAGWGVHPGLDPVWQGDLLDIRYEA